MLGQIDIDNPYAVKVSQSSLVQNQNANSYVSLPSVRTSNASPAQAAILKRKQINASMNEHIALS